MKKFLITLLALSMLAVSALAVGVPFERVREYPEGKFTDVPADAWYADNVKAAYELRLIDGKAEDKFAPDDPLTVVEAVKIAATLRAIYTDGAAEFEPSSPWYQTYVDYAQAQGIYEPAMGELTQPATRAQFARIFAGALPEDALSPINAVADGSIPDVAMESDYAGAAYLLYRAGVLTGSGEDGAFAPDSQISRKEAAAIVTRMADPALRKTFGETAEEQPETPDGEQAVELPYYEDIPGVPDFGALYGCADQAERQTLGDGVGYLYEVDEATAELTGEWAALLGDVGFQYIMMQGAAMEFRNPAYPEFAVILRYFSGTQFVIGKAETPGAKPASPLELYPDGPGDVPDFGAAVGWSQSARTVVDEEMGTVQYLYTGSDEALNTRFLAWYDQLMLAGYTFNGTSGQYNLSSWYNEDQTWCVLEGLLPDGRYVVGIIPIV